MSEELNNEEVFTSSDYNGIAVAAVMLIFWGLVMVLIAIGS